MTERMKKLLARFMRFCNRPWVKWSVIVILVVAVTVVHFVMADKYGDSPSASTWEFTATLHATMLVVALLAVVFYKKCIKRKLMEYEND